MQERGEEEAGVGTPDASAAPSAGGRLPKAIVLAGGAGTRLGGSKAATLLAGRPLLNFVTDAARTAGLEPVVVAKARTALPAAMGCRVVIEPDEPLHPLCGIVAGLRAAADWGPHRAAVVCTCDMPFLDAGLLAWLAALDAPLAVVQAGPRLNPLLGRYDRGLLDLLTAALTSQPSMNELVRRIGARVVDTDELARFGDPARICFNVNAPEDLVAAERLLRLDPAGEIE